MSETQHVSSLCRIYSQKQTNISSFAILNNDKAQILGKDMLMLHGENYNC